MLDEFLEVFDKIMAFQQSSRFTNVLPSDIRKLYAALMTDDAYLMKLSLSQIAKLLYLNANPMLLSLNIKVSLYFNMYYS